ncbi:MAG: hypothetical protein ABWZ77_04745 [Naasia sp.]
MSSERDPNPSEKEAAGDFSVPEDADFTTPGEPMSDEDGEEPRAATPGNPIADEPATADDYTTPGEPLDDRDHLADEHDGDVDSTPGNPLGR